MGRDAEYAVFLSDLFALVGPLESETLYGFRTRKPGLGPELVKVIDALASFRETWVESPGAAPFRAPLAEVHEAVGLPFEDAALIDDLFRSSELFPKNDDLITFVREALGLDLFGKNYSRKMVSTRAKRALSRMPVDERHKFLALLNDFRKKAVRGDRSTDGFLRQWTRIIKGGE